MQNAPKTTKRVFAVSLTRLRRLQLKNINKSVKYKIYEIN